MGKSFGPKADRLSRHRDRYRTPERNAGPYTDSGLVRTEASARV